MPSFYAVLAEPAGKAGRLFQTSYDQSRWRGLKSASEKLKRDQVVSQTRRGRNEQSFETPPRCSLTSIWTDLCGTLDILVCPACVHGSPGGPYVNTVGSHSRPIGSAPAVVNR